MTKTYEFNENLAIADNETHDAVVSHFNQIEEFANNKKFEWEDEPIPEDNYCVTFDFDEWLNDALEYTNKFYVTSYYDKPENLKEDIIGYYNQIKEYFDGFLLGPTALYKKHSIEAKTHTVEGENFDKIVEFARELKETNDFVFLYQIYRVPQRMEEIVIKGTDWTGTYPKTSNSYYKLRYGVVND